MPTRFNTKSKENYGTQPLQSGYPNSNESAEEYVIPPVGIEDVDIGIFNLFDKEIPFQVGGVEGQQLKKVPVVFAGGEKWALIKRNKPLRDKVGSLILPIITIVRPNISQTASEDLAGRGINQKTGEIIIKRKLGKSDRNYQNLINRFFLKGQESLAVQYSDEEQQQLKTNRDIGDLSQDGMVIDGSLMTSGKDKNIYETFVIPSPQFYTANYEITVWTQYTHHMNQILETMISSFLPQTQGWRIDTAKGYWFVGIMSDETYNAENNFDDMSQDERIIKYKFNVKVPAYILASSAPGVPISIKKYVSCPIVSFTASEIAGPQDSMNNTVEDPFLGNDDPTLPLQEERSSRNDQRRTGGNYLFSDSVIDPNDPALQGRIRGQNGPLYKRMSYKDFNNNVVTKFVRIKSGAGFGETTYTPNANVGSGYDLDGIDLSIVDE